MQEKEDAQGQKRNFNEISDDIEPKKLVKKQKLSREQCYLLWLAKKASETKEMTSASLAYGLAILPNEMQARIIKMLNLYDQIDPYYIGRLINSDSFFTKEDMFINCVGTSHNFTEYITIDYHQKKAIGRFRKCNRCRAIDASSVTTEGPYPSIFHQALFFLYRKLSPKEYLYYEVSSGDLLYCAINYIDWFRLRAGAPLTRKRDLLKGKLSLCELLLLLLRQQPGSDETNLFRSLNVGTFYALSNNNIPRAQELRRNQKELLEEELAFERLKLKIMQLTKEEVR